jgi:type II secretory pathway predicted ATPase ExeA
MESAGFDSDRRREEMNMFLEHYGLIEQPFGVTPDPRFLHMGAKHREALASLVYGTETNRGFLALIAQPGMGKTSLLYQYLEGLRNKSRAAFIFQTDCGTEDFIRHILVDLSLDVGGKDLPTMFGMLHEVLLGEMRAGRRFILVIDEAQNLDERVLESVRLLSNFETPWMKLMHIVIAGQLQLAERLTRPSMAQLRQRISSVIRIEPFTAEETGEYIDHRLWVAGHTGEPLFTVGARLLIAKQSGGIPRNINTLCFNAMSAAYGVGAHQVDVKMVREAINDVEIESLVPRAERTPPHVAAPGRTILPFRTMLPKLKEHGINRLLPACAVVCALLLFALSARVGWNVGKRTPPFDVLFAGETDTPPQIARPLPPVAAENSPEIATNAAVAPLANFEAPSPPRGNAGGGDAAVAPLSTVPARPNSAMPAAPLPTSVAVGLSDNHRILTVAIEKDTALLDICMQHLDRFDTRTLEETLALNPSLSDVNHIAAGQRIRLPLYLRRGFVSQADTAYTSGTLEAHKQRP